MTEPEPPKLARRGTRGPLPTVTLEEKRERKRTYMAERRKAERRESGGLAQTVAEQARSAALKRLVADYPERFGTYLREERDRRGIQDRIYPRKQREEQEAS